MMYLGKDPVGLATSIPEFADIAKIECGNYTPSTDETAMEVRVSHSLGELPDFLLFFSDTITASNESEVSYTVNGTIVRQNTSNSYNGFVCTLFTVANKTTYNRIVGSIGLDSFLSDHSFTFFGNTDIKLKANTTYHYIIGKFKEVTPNA